MIGIIKSAAHVTWLAASYIAIMIYLTNGLYDVFDMLGGTFGTIPQLIVNVMGCVISTLNWIFSPVAVKFAMAVWWLWPEIKLGIYVSHKVHHV